MIIFGVDGDEMLSKTSLQALNSKTKDINIMFFINFIIYILLLEVGI
ncbi:hypothetical protein ACOL21_11070 [Aliarcobacter butzleri]